MLRNTRVVNELVGPWGRTVAAVAFVLAAMPAPARADDVPGCTKDADCKGDRICDAGKCVNPTPTAAPPMPARPTAPTAGLVMVHVNSNEPKASLARVSSAALAYGSNGASASALGFDIVCTAPCDMGVEPNQEYVFRNVSGFGAHSGSFVIPATTSQLTLNVESHSQGMYVLGFLGVTFGGTGVLLGGTFAGVGAGVGNDGFVTAGLITLAFTVPMTIWGIYEMVHNGTTVKSGDGTELALRKKKTGFGVTPTGFGWAF